MGSTLRYRIRTGWHRQSRSDPWDYRCQIPISMPSTKTKIIHQDYDAEFGKAIGAIVTNTDQIRHQRDPRIGVVDFQRSNSNFARNPFNQAGGVPSGNWNQFGGTLGGPIKKNKLFRFWRLPGSAQPRWRFPSAALCRLQPCAVGILARS